MAVPQLASAGNAPSMKEMLGQQDRAGDLLTNLVDLSKQLVKGQEKLFEKLLLVLDQKKEDTTPQRVSGSVGKKGKKDKAFMPTPNFAKLLGGALAAITLWSNDLAKYIRAAFLPSQLLKPVMTAFKTAFSSAAIAKAFKPIDNFFGRINKALAPKNFVSLTKAIDFFTVPLQNVIKGFTAVGERVDNFGNTIKVAFKDLGTASKIGASIRAIVDPFVRFFKFIGDISGITKSVGKAVSMFAKVMPALKGIASKFLLPLFAIFDFVSGFIEGFSSKGEDDTRGTMEKVLDGLVAGAIKLIKGIFIVPLDLLKDGVSWLAEKMGFENFSKALDSFSFNDTFDKFIKFGKNLFSSEPEEGYFSIVKWAGDGIDSLVKSMKDLIPNDIIGSLKKLAGAALDIVTAPHRWLWNNAIKPAIDSIIEMFGGSAELPDTGEIGDFISKKIIKLFEAIKLWIAEKIPGGNKLLETLGLGKVSERTLQEKKLADQKLADLKKLADLEEEARTGKVLLGDDEKYRAFKAKEAAALKEKLGLNNPTGAQLAADTQDVATKKEEKQAGATVVSAPSDNRDMRQTSFNSSTYMAPSPSSYPSDPNWDFEAAGR